MSNTPWMHTIDKGVRLLLWVQPRASRLRVGPIYGERIKISITSAPVDGAANQAVIALLSKTFRVPKGHIVMRAGHTSRKKTVEVHGISPTDVEQVITG